MFRCQPNPLYTVNNHKLIQYSFVIKTASIWRFLYAACIVKEITVSEPHHMNLHLENRVKRPSSLKLALVAVKKTARTRRRRRC